MRDENRDRELEIAKYKNTKYSACSDSYKGIRYFSKPLLFTYKPHIINIA